MPPKTTFQREDIIKAAFEIIKEQGLQKLSARKVAEKLGSSTAPVYSCFGSMHELLEEVVEKVKELMYRYLTKEYTENTFLNMGVGTVLFSRDYSRLYQSLFMTETGEAKYIIDELREPLVTEMKKVPKLAGLSAAERKQLLWKMRIFTYGFATQMSIGLIEEGSIEYITDTLRSVGKAIIDAAIAEKTGRND